MEKKEVQTKSIFQGGRISFIVRAGDVDGNPIMSGTLVKLLFRGSLDLHPAERYIYSIREFVESEDESIPRGTIFAKLQAVNLEDDFEYNGYYPVSSLFKVRND